MASPEDRYQEKIWTTQTLFPESSILAQKKTVLVNDLQLGVIQYGRFQPQQPVLVLLHGFTGCASSWEEVIPLFALSGWHIIAFDLHGHGQSEVPATPERGGMEHCAEDLLAALRLLEVEPQQAILLGYSLGGRIALYTAFSGYFRGLILESASPGLATEAEREQRRMSDEHLAQYIENEGIEAFVDYWEVLPLFASQQALAPDRWLVQRHQRLANNQNGLAMSLRGVGTGSQPALHNRLSELNLPVLLITGALDTKFTAINEQMRTQLPQATHQIIPEAGHTVHLEQPQQFAQIVHTFCTKVLS